MNQNQVAARLELARMTVSHAVGALSDKGLVSRGGPMSGHSLRIFVGERGDALLRRLEPAIEEASAAQC